MYILVIKRPLIDSARGNLGLPKQEIYCRGNN